ncbi:ATP-binding cassette domain-containing protein [Rhodococcus sp. (in: high G+C Gram-positive bacteria)]|uniref:ATP-binding cassette domain-containing protein n=1 Tax=unclassified Rhodococcus (in: high G+C Gram-positive bacteria) TaxID=192944 RepID=UPI002ADC8B95|nr:ATP-binding cassette domain-containing protein [Rhodococcus sp. (in: high G+C Gram-positive bacteria)]
MSTFRDQIWALSLSAVSEGISFPQVDLNQDSSLVVGTVRENLMLGIDGGVSEDAIWRSLGQVCLAERVRRLPAGSDTVIGGGVELSGGERQRLALARVFMVDRPLVLLDEPTSSVDSNNERSIVESSTELSVRSSVIVVTRKSAIVEGANTVITVEGGRVQSTLGV